jgi:hypothetical protein
MFTGEHATPNSNHIPDGISAAFIDHSSFYLRIVR